MIQLFTREPSLEQHLLAFARIIALKIQKYISMWLLHTKSCSKHYKVGNININLVLYYLFLFINSTYQA